MFKLIPHIFVSGSIDLRQWNKCQNDHRSIAYTSSKTFH